MDMAAVEGADAAGGMNMPSIAHGDGWSGEASHLMEVDFGEVGCDLESVDVIAIGNRYNLSGHASEAVVVGYLGEDAGAALDLVDMGLGGNNIIAQGNPSCPWVFYSICGQSRRGLRLQRK